MAETLEKLAARILKDIATDKHDEFLDWAISGMPIRTATQKQTIIERTRLLALIDTKETKGGKG